MQGGGSTHNEWYFGWVAALQKLIFCSKIQDLYQAVDCLRLSIALV